MNLAGYPLTCRLAWTWDVSSVLRASLEGMVFARRINERSETNYKRRIFLESLHSNIDKNSVNEIM